MRIKIALSIIAACCGAAGVRAQHDPLAPLDFLIGTWKSAAGTERFQRDLDGHILQRRSQSTSARADGKTRRLMRTYLTIYPTADYTGFDALYLDDLGHVILYNEVSVLAGESVQFTSSGPAPLPSFRLTYILKTPSRLHVTFERALLGQPGAYQLIAESEEIRKN